MKRPGVARKEPSPSRRLYLARRWCAGPLLLLLLVAACGPGREDAAIDPSTAVTAGPVQPLAPRLAAVPPSPSSPAPSPAPYSPTPLPEPPARAVTPTPSAQPRVLRLALPESMPWLEHTLGEWLRENKGRLNNRDLRLSVQPEPAAALQAGAVDLALIVRLDPEPAGRLLARRPLALTVPFVDPRPGLDLASARALALSPAAGMTAMDWAEMTPDRRSLPVAGYRPDEPDYPLQQHLLLMAAPTFAADADHLAPLLTPWLGDRRIHLVAVGDLMLDRGLGYVLGQQQNLEYPFAHVQPWLAVADVTIGNLESALGATGSPANKSYTFQAPPQAAEALARAGFDVLSLANNHALDFGPEALLEGMALLQNHGIITVGAGADATAARSPRFVSHQGLTLAFLGYVHVPVEYRGFDTQTWTATTTAPGLAWGDPAVITADVAAAATQADHVIVMLHSGFEYQEAPSPPQIAAAEAAIDAGATLVIGHHAHILQGVAFRDSGVIVYGLGNFAFEIDGDPSTAMLNVWLDADGVRELAFTPAIIEVGGRPRPATPVEASAVQATLRRLTRILNPGRFTSGDGQAAGE